MTKLIDKLLDGMSPERKLRIEKMSEKLLSECEYIEISRKIFEDLLEEGSFYPSAIELGFHLSGEEFEERIKEVLKLLPMVGKSEEEVKM